LNLFFLFNERRLRPGWRVVLFFSSFILISGISLFPLVALVLTTWLLTRFVDRRPLDSVGLALEGAAARQFAAGMVFGGSLLVAAVVLIGLFGSWQFSAGNVSGNAVGVLLFYTLVHLNIATLEELLARGYVLQTLLEGLGPVPAVLLSALGFAAFHLDNPQLTAIGLLNLSLAGVFLGSLVLKTRSLWMAIGFHFTWNLVQGHALGLPVSGILLDDYWVKLQLEGPRWLSGGAFGPEGSALTSVVLLVATLGLWRAPWPRPGPKARALWQEYVWPRGRAS